MFSHDLRGDSLKALFVGKGVSTLLTFISGFGSYIATELITQNVVYGVIATAVATTIVGISSSYPRWVKARGEDWAAIVRELREQNSQRLAVLERQIAFQNRERVLMRASKHKLAGYLQVAQNSIFILEFTCRQRGVEFEPYNQVNLHDAFSEEDEQMKKMTEIQLASINTDDGIVPADLQ